MRDVYASARERLGCLVGEIFTGAGRALDMGILCFGSDVSWMDEHSDTPKTASRYAIHAQCPFRVVYDSRIILGSDDMQHTRESAVVSGETIAADNASTMYDVMAEHLNQAISPSRPTVTCVNLTELGFIDINLSNGLQAEVFPASSRGSESWRFLERRGEHVIFPWGR